KDGAGAVYVGGGTGTSIWSTLKDLNIAYGGTVSAAPGGSIRVGTGLAIGAGTFRGSGTLTIAGGSLSCDGPAFIGQSSATGMVTITDAGTFTNKVAQVGRIGGTGTVNVGGRTGTSVWSN